MRDVSNNYKEKSMTKREDYKMGIRVAKTLSPWFGFGWTSYSEIGLVVCFYKWEITIGSVYKSED